MFGLLLVGHLEQEEHQVGQLGPTHGALQHVFATRGHSRQSLERKPYLTGFSRLPPGGLLESLVAAGLFALYGGFYAAG